MWSRCDCEGVELVWCQSRAGGVDVLPREELVVGRAVELDLDHLGGKQLGLQDVKLHVAAPHADHLVEDEEEPGNNEKHPELWSLGDSGKPVHQLKKIEQDVKLVSQPEESVSFFSDLVETILI